MKTIDFVISVISVFIFTSVFCNAMDKIDICLDTYGKVWDIKNQKCIKASIKDLPYSKREIK